jgi:ankyrin repeat protein
MVNTKQLRRAINSGDAKQVGEILRASSTPNIQLANDWSPLHVAAKRGSRDVAAAILDAGADLNATTGMLQTPLDVALLNDNKPVAELLRRKGALPGSELSLHAASSAGDLKAVKKHVAAGADINRLVNGNRPIGLALAFRRWDVAKFLLKKGCDVTKPSYGHATPLHVAASFDAPDELLALLLKLGALIDPLDDCDHTPLCYAASAGDERVVDWLIEHGANVARGQERSSTPVYCALARSHTELASHLIDRGGKSTLHQAVQCNHLARARQQLNAGANPNLEGDPHQLESPLFTAIWRDDSDMAAILLEFGADPNQQDETFQGRHGMVGGNASLHQAVCKGSAKMVKLLLAHGADPDIGNAEGMSPIELARSKDRIHLVNLMETHLDKKLSLTVTESGIEQLYPVHKVAELLSVDDAFVLELIKVRKITCLKLDDKTLRIPAGSVRRYLAKLAT